MKAAMFFDDFVTELDDKEQDDVLAIFEEAIFRACRRSKLSFREWKKAIETDAFALATMRRVLKDCEPLVVKEAKHALLPDDYLRDYLTNVSLCRAPRDLFENNENENVLFSNE